MSVKHRHVPDQDGYVRVAADTGLIVGPRALCGGPSGGVAGAEGFGWPGTGAFALRTALCGRPYGLRGVSEPPRPSAKPPRQSVRPSPTGRTHGPSGTHRSALTVRIVCPGQYAPTPRLSSGPLPGPSPRAVLTFPKSLLTARTVPRGPVVSRDSPGVHVCVVIRRGGPLSVTANRTSRIANRTPSCVPQPY